MSQRHQTKLTRIILGDDLVSGETAVKPKRRNRLSVEAYRKRARKGWETRKKQARLRGETFREIAGKAA